MSAFRVCKKIGLLKILETNTHFCSGRKILSINATATCYSCLVHSASEPKATLSFFPKRMNSAEERGGQGVTDPGPLAIGAHKK